MYVPSRNIVTQAVIIAIASGAWAQPRSPSTAPEPDDRASPQMDLAERLLTGKERLGKKWADEQRTDNCHVPPDKRGAKPRPDCDAPSR